MTNINTELKLYKNKIFDDIKHIDEYGNEFWYARELSKILKYNNWRNFLNVINKAKNTCVNSNNDIRKHIVEVDRVLTVGNNAKMKVNDYILSRYACYLIVQNGDSRKKEISFGQTYFAIQTRKQELIEENIKSLTEEEKRLKIRYQVKEGNKNLNDTVYEVGARTNNEFAKFHNEGYKGLYNGETVSKIKKRKKLSKNDDILDYMGSTELAANWFRITQADEMIKNNNIDNLDEANKTHNKVGKEVRKTMTKLSGIVPEELPTPQKSIKEIEVSNINKLETK